MKTRTASRLAGILFLVLCGSALAHQPVRHDPYPAAWTGGVTLWGGTHGPAAWSGSLSYGSPYVYAPGYIPWVAVPAGHRHTARCNHGPRHDYSYQKGYAHGRHDNHRRGKSRGHGRGYDD